MDIKDEQLRDNGTKPARKPYRKPAVQVYGTLTQMTGATNFKPSAFKADPSAPPAPTRRT